MREVVEKRPKYNSRAEEQNALNRGAYELARFNEMYIKEKMKADNASTA